MRKSKQAEVIRASKYAHQKIECIINARLADKDITAAQSHVLMYIIYHPAPVYPSDIQRDMHISAATVSGLVKKLRSKGYLTLEGCDTDERRRGLIVTEKALSHKAEIESCMSSIEDHAFKGFTEEELENLHGLLIRMAENLKNTGKEEQ
ncbi:MarR family transcriptional regulator [Ruminococcus sp.]|uniref:MarR family winged helix-turn-helix transcriptional regulator n=1 Tax=Ruminococcus sp. TaxID=41978 RepID=UPI0025F3823A|nr:MarR family transcriptional regulator [Ruminococcus sp.]MBQ8967055.1 MarR family transcriptional regulator [Ruminococcus sp.]